MNSIHLKLIKSNIIFAHAHAHFNTNRVNTHTQRESDEMISGVFVWLNAWWSYTDTDRHTGPHESFCVFPLNAQMSFCHRTLSIVQHCFAKYQTKLHLNLHSFGPVRFISRKSSIAIKNQVEIETSATENGYHWPKQKVKETKGFAAIRWYCRRHWSILWGTRKIATGQYTAQTSHMKKIKVRFFVLKFNKWKLNRCP